MLEFQSSGKDIVTFTVNDESGHEVRWAEGLTVVYVLRGAAKVVKYEKFLCWARRTFWSSIPLSRTAFLQAQEPMCSVCGSPSLRLQS